MVGVQRRLGHWTVLLVRWGHPGMHHILTGSFSCADTMLGVEGKAGARTDAGEPLSGPTARIQVRDGGSLLQDDGHCAGGRWFNSGSILKVEPTTFTEGTKCEKGQKHRDIQSDSIV